MAGDVPLVLRVDLAFIREELSAPFRFTQAGLPIRVSAKDHQTTILNIISENVQRARELHINAERDALGRLYTMMDKFQLTTAPLVSIRIKCAEFRRSPLPLPNSLANCIAPELSHLEIHNGKFSLGCALLGKALGHLELTANKEQTLGSLKTVLDCLHNLPNLHTLILRHCLPASSSLPPGGQIVEKLRHPSLVRIELEGDISNCAMLLEHMDVRYPTCVELKCSADPVQESLLYPFLASISQGEGRGWIRVLSLTGHTTGRISSLAAWQSDLKDSIGRWDDSFHGLGKALLSVQIGYRHDRGGIGAGALCAAMQLGNVRTLAMRQPMANSYVPVAADHWSVAAWWRAFGQCTNLTHLASSGGNLDVLTKALSARREVNNAIMLKKLKFIALQGLRADDSYSMMIYRMLANRRRHDAPILELRLHGCDGFTDSDRLCLEPAVPKLHWDIIHRPPSQASIDSDYMVYGDGDYGGGDYGYDDDYESYY